jgi:hypothetical protein
VLALQRLLEIGIHIDANRKGWPAAETICPRLVEPATTVARDPEEAFGFL